MKAAASGAAQAWPRYPVDLIDTLRLADGRAVMLRPVLPHDARAEGEFVSRLSPLSRRLRFHGAVNELPEATLRSMTRIDHEHHVALVARALGPQAGPRIVADARFVHEHLDDGGESGWAEFAVAVADDWQGLGLGRALLMRLSRHARAQGLRELRGSVLADNVRMLGLLQSLGARLEPDARDNSVLRVRLMA